MKYSKISIIAAYKYLVYNINIWLTNINIVISDLDYISTKTLNYGQIK